MEVNSRNLNDKIGFRDIYTWDGMETVPQEVERGGKNQYIDIHADARGYGRPGLLPPRNESDTDRSLIKEFGRHTPKVDFNPSSLDVTNSGGSILEIGAIDHPKLRPLLMEIKRGKRGKATEQMINKLLRGFLGQDYQVTPTQEPTAPTIKPKPKSRYSQRAQEVSSYPSYESSGTNMIALLTPIPSGGSGSSGHISVPGGVSDISSPSESAETSSHMSNKYFGRSVTAQLYKFG